MPHSKHSLGKMRKFFAFILVCSMLFSCFSCSKKDTDEEQEHGENNATSATVIDKEYKIIYDSENSRAGKVAAYLQVALSRSFRLTLRISRDDKEPIGAKEILLGNTSRDDASQETADIGSGGWCVHTEGQKIIIRGATSEALTEAAEYFVSSLTPSDNGTAGFANSLSKIEYKIDSLAAASIKLRVATFNIANGSGVSHKMEELAALISPLNLDIISLQEVDVGTGRVGGIDTLKEISQAAGYRYYAFSPAIDFRGGQYGHGIISKYPIKSYETIVLTTPADCEQRVLGHATIEINGQCIDYYNTHLSFESTEARVTQFKELNAAISGKRGFILTADFNTDSASEKEAVKNSVSANSGKYVTFPSKNSAIDDILLQSGWDIISAGVLDAGGKSDHNLFYAEVHFVG